MLRKFLVINIFILIAITVFAQKPDPDFIDKIAGLKAENMIKKSAITESRTNSTYDLIYQRLEFKIDPAQFYIQGAVTSYFKAQNNSFDTLCFDLHSSLSVDSVIQGKQKTDFIHTENKISVLLKSTLNKGEIDSLAIYYQGKPLSSGFGAFSQGYHDDVPVVWTLSEPYGAMEWWPCKQSLADKIDSIDVIVHSPEKYRTASNGVLVEESVSNGKRKMHWKHRFPIATYLVAVAVTNYVDYSEYLELDDGRKIQILNYVYPEKLNSAKNDTKVTSEIISLYNNLVGEYPFAREKYGHAQFGWGGGMEHQTMSFMYNFNFELVAHELAHQWFGDYITLGSWQDIWLNEGFATYFTGLSYENLLGGIWWPVWKKLNVQRIVSEPGGSVFVTDTSSVSRIFSGRLSYSKGACLLHMLRWVLGDETFFYAIKNYFSDPEIANGFARTHQLVKHFEEAGDTVLTDFFDDWFYGEGFPVYSLKYAQSEKHQLKIKLSQTTSHPSIGFFKMPVPVRVYNLEKTDSLDYRLEHKMNNEIFWKNPGFQVSEIKIDPDYWLVCQTSDISEIAWTSLAEEIKVFPNPVLDKVTVTFTSSEKPKTTNLFSGEGKLIRQFREGETEFDLSNLPDGMYILQFEIFGEKVEKKIVKL